MSLHKKVILDNGQEFNYFKIGTLNIFSDKIEVVLDCFKTEEVFESFKKRIKCLKEQKLLVKEFETLSKKEKPTKKEKEKLDELQNKINDLASEIDSIGAEENLISATLREEIPFIEDFSELNIEKELLNTRYFKLAKIIE